MFMEKLERILLINDFHQGGGAEKIFRDTYNYLKDHYEVLKFYASEKPKRPSDFLSYVYSHHYFNKLHELLIEFKPDIIHVHNYYHLLTPSILDAIGLYKKGRNNVKVIMTAHDFHLICPNSGYYYFPPLRKRNLIKFTLPPSIFQIFYFCFDYRGFRHSLIKKIQWLNAYYIKKAFRSIDIIISPSQFLKYHLELKFKDQFSYFLLRNPLEALPQKKGDINRTTPERLKMVFIGRLSFEKGLLEYIKALKRLSNVDYIFDIYGDGEYGEILEDEIVSQGLSSKINLKGSIGREELNNTLLNYHALVLPTLCYENAPLSIVEAASLNLRIITCNYGGMKEMASICKGEYLIDPYDESSIHKAIINCFDDITRQNRIEGRDIQKIKEIFSETTYTMNLIKLYKSNVL